MPELKRVLQASDLTTDAGRGTPAQATPMPSLTETAIRQRTSPESFSRGVEYFRRGAVVRRTRRGDLLQAEVEGSSYQPYQVTVRLDPLGILEAACSCPYEWGGDCKHIVATLLACLNDPNDMEVLPSLESMLDPLDRDQLRELLLWVAARRPDIADAIESRALAMTTPAPSPVTGPGPVRARQTALDPQVYRREVSAAVHSLSRMRPSEAYWQVGGVAQEVRSIAEQALPFIEAGDGRNALVILEAVTDEYTNIWYELDDSDGEAADVFEALGLLWAEALLTADLDRFERQAWTKRLARWAKDMSDYGVEDAFLVAESAAVQGWDDPRLLRILAGEAIEEDAPTGEVTDEPEWDAEDDDDFEDDDHLDDELEDGLSYRFSARDWTDGQLVRVRLKILERQGRTQEYLNLARAEGQTVAYGAMLMRLGQVDEAVAHALTQLTRPQDALTLARSLQEYGRAEDALRVAEHGLTLEPVRDRETGYAWQPYLDDEAYLPAGGRVELARWLRDAAQSVGEHDRAVNAARVAVEASADLDDYRAVEALAAETWPEMREAILTHLRRGQPSGRVNTVAILLYEGLIDEAIAIADAASYAYHLVEQVADAAIESHPEWVIRASRAQAEQIMDAGKSQHYDTAARWLAKARAASAVAGRDEEWAAYLSELLDIHRRKYKLVPLLQQLR